MTERKPRSMSVDDWVEGQIHRAEAEGAFQNLPGAGKPIPGLDREQDPMTWIVNKLRSEGVDPVDVLPPQLALAREAELVSEYVRTLPSEVMVLSYLDDLNSRINRAHARPQIGPPMRTKLVKIEPIVDAWREHQAEVARSKPAPPVEPKRRRWYQRRTP